MNPKNFFAELKRRNVYKVAVAYAVVSWLLIQIATQVFPFFEIPIWATRMVVILLLLGFPVALVLAWAYELTPEGIKLTDEVDREKSIRRSTGRILDFVIIGVLLLVIAVFAYQRFGPVPVRDPPGKSIAVLPFVDLSQDKNQEYFSDGITEQIINSLAKIRGLLVVARTSAFVFKNKPEDIRDVGNRLHVTHVLEGSVNHGTGRVRVDTRLIDVTNGFQLWSETYDSSEQDILLLQSDVAQKVANALQIELHLAEAKQIAKPPTYDAEAYDLYLRGRYFLNKRTVDSLQKALVLFEQAVAKDPRFALGHAGIADACILLGLYGAISAEEASKRAWPEASAAIEMDDHLAAGYVSRAMLLTDFEWNWRAAEADFRKALKLDSSSVTARHWYAFHLAEIGRFNEALQVIEAAQKLDPISPIIRGAKARILLMARRYDEAITQAREALDLQANFAPALAILARGYALRQQYSEAIAAAKKHVEQGADSRSFELAYVYAAAGNRTELDKLMNGQREPYSPYGKAILCAALHDNAGALHWLELAIEQQSSLEVAWAKVDPRLDNIRADPGFQKLLARMTPRGLK